MALWIIILNILDLVFTIILVDLGAATEINPVVDHLLRTNLLALIGLKIGIITAFMVILNRYTYLRRVRIALRLVLLVFCIIMGLHAVSTVHYLLF